MSGEEAIKNLQSMYAWYTHGGDWGAYADAGLDGGGILELAREIISDLYTYSKHTGQMPRISIDDDAATGTGEWYLGVFYEKPGGGEGWVTGTYSDEYRRVDGEWKFAAVENESHHDSGTGSPHIPGANAPKSAVPRHLTGSSTRP